MDANRTLLDDVSCSSSRYLMLFQCSVSTFISNLCSDNDDISVTCCKWFECAPSSRLTSHLAIMQILVVYGAAHMLVRFVSQVVIILMKVSLRFIVMAFGVLFVIIHSVVQQQQLYVSSWGTTNTISSIDYQCKLFTVFLAWFIFCLFLYSVGAATQSVWLNSLSCRSSYSCLSSCQSCPSSASTACVHAEDVTVVCCKWSY